MKILAVDTATRELNVAVAGDGQEHIGITLNAGLTHSQFLMPAIDAALHLAGLDLKSIDGFAVTVGPGSFTGLRIGMSAVKGLASAMNKPVAGVITLEVLAYPFRGFPSLVCPLIDARKQEVYAALYRFEEERLVKIAQETILSIHHILDMIHEKCVFVGSGALLHRSVIMDRLGYNAVFPSETAHALSPSALAQLGVAAFMRQQAGPPADILPLYLRASDAEITIAAGPWAMGHREGKTFPVGDSR
jgi:tRNA threonylcarbamoyladenosine biosynthesis protein TsaB